MKIYLDVLIITNCVMTLIFLSCISRLTHSATSRVRLVLSSCIGGIASLIVAVNTNGFFQSVCVTLVKFLLIGLIVFTAFDLRTPARLLKYIFLYFFCELVFAGVSLLIWEMTDSRIIYVKNYTVYFDISLIYLVVATILIYVILSVYEWLRTYRFSAYERYKAVYTIGNYAVELPAVADTGNNLHDAFTGVPIIIFFSAELFEHFNLDCPEKYTLESFRIAPYSTIGGNGILPVTSKGNVTISDSKGNSKQVKCCVGILHSGKDKSRAIFNPCLLQ